MAIRPVDLQLAYMAAPQNAAVINAAQQGPQAAQQAAASAFAAEVTKREEQIEEPDKAHGSKVRAREEREHTPDHQQQRRGRQTPYEQNATASESIALAGDGEHFIDVTA
jgi:hypothetical protein